MASYKFLLDADVRHLAACFPTGQVQQLEDLGLSSDAGDDEIIESAQRSIIVTNNRRDFESGVQSRISRSSKKKNRCTQVHGLIIVLPSDKLLQIRAIERAAKQLFMDDEALTWKDVNERCLKVIIEESGKAKVSKLPRCPACSFDDEE